MSSEASANLSPATNYNTLRAIEPPRRHGVHAPEQRGYPQLRVLSQRISAKVPRISTKIPWISAKHAGYPQGTQDIRKGHVDICKAVWMSTTPPQQIENENIRSTPADIISATSAAL
ncbi:hypothetical protein M422DRAFT_264861 [Sphaerobolus stellatus SS14]|uniref:Uncharacterized protein n=1 Tax=Sphaerobolus stellatus (strain SS14) TaxID=990650 RepID=A0A0C9V7A0_SPHS4|nr:hypothetical protein M422DRAFT_264861 [Sphaerobolus stellatus SS14]